LGRFQSSLNRANWRPHTGHDTSAPRLRSTWTLRVIAFTDRDGVRTGTFV
jgi:hypothetical protein